MNEKKLQDDIDFHPEGGQEQVEKCESRDIAVCAGRRWGKSKICAYVILRELLKGKKINVWIVAPTYNLADKVFHWLVIWIVKILPSQKGGISARPFPQIKLANGSVVMCKSAENPTDLLGEDVNFLIVDEAAQISKNVYERYLYPTTTSSKGRTIFISTPFGKNWFYHKWLECKETNGAFHFMTKDRPSFPQEEWDKAKRIMPEQVFKQEFMAEFLDDAASVFRGVREVIKDNCLKDVVPGHNYVMGVDFGKHEDFTTITVIDKYNNNVVFQDRFNKIDYPFQKARITATATRYNNSRIIVDSTVVGEPIKEDLERQGLFVDDFKFTNKSKKELVEKLSIFIEQKNVFIPPDPIWIDELEAFGYQLSDAGNVIYRAPEGQHDDCVFSLALAVWGLTGRARLLTALQEEFLKVKRNKPKVNYI